MYLNRTMNNTNLLKNRMLNYIRFTLLVIEYYFAIFSFSVIIVGENNIGTDKISVLYIGPWLFCIAPNIVIALDIVIALPILFQRLYVY